MARLLVLGRPGVTAPALPNLMGANMLIRMTTGTMTYGIPMTRGLKLKHGYPLEIEEHEKCFLVICPYFGEYGHGDTYDSALKELGSSLSDLWYSLQKRGNKLSKELEHLIEEVETTE